MAMNIWPPKPVNNPPILTAHRNEKHAKPTTARFLLPLTSVKHLSHLSSDHPTSVDLACSLISSDHPVSVDLACMPLQKKIKKRKMKIC